MIQVHIAHGRAHSLTMRGHAGYHPGCDIVCAGASAIAYALLGYLHNAEEHIEGTMEERIERGDLAVRCAGDGMIAAAFDMAEIGLLQLEKRYPEHVSVKPE